MQGRFLIYSVMIMISSDPLVGPESGQEIDMNLISGQMQNKTFSGKQQQSVKPANCTAAEKSWTWRQKNWLPFLGLQMSSCSAPLDRKNSLEAEKGGRMSVLQTLCSPVLTPPST